MYEIGQLIIYGSTGVCRVTDITKRTDEGTKQEYLYYVLKPLYHDYTIFVPTNTTKVFMRPIITKDEALRLIDRIPFIQVEAYHSRTLSQLSEHYKALLETHECIDLIELCMSIYAKKQDAEQQKRKIGAVDEKFMRRAEDLLFGELAAALDIDKEQVTDFIAERLNDKQTTN